MGNTSAKESIAIENAIFADRFLQEHIPKFVKQYCNVREGTYVNGDILFEAFNVFLANLNYPKPIKIGIKPEIVQAIVCKMIAKEALSQINKKNKIYLRPLLQTNDMIFINLELMSFPLDNANYCSSISDDAKIPSFYSLVNGK